MTTHIARCRCGQLQAICEGEPVRVSVCHCLACQQRSGSAFATQARWLDEKVTTEGEHKLWERIADSGHKVSYRFCPVCGATVFYTIEGWPGLTAVPVGLFTDPDFPAPRFSVYEHRRKGWVEITGEGIEHSETPSSQRNPGAGLADSVE